MSIVAAKEKLSLDSSMANAKLVVSGVLPIYEWYFGVSSIERSRSLLFESTAPSLDSANLSLPKNLRQPCEILFRLPAP